jgi:hypothetical protein
MGLADYCKYVHMIEKDNRVHIESVRDVRMSEVGRHLIDYAVLAPLSFS